MICQLKAKLHDSRLRTPGICTGSAIFTAVCAICVMASAKAQQLVVDFPQEFQIISPGLQFFPVRGRIDGIPISDLGITITVYPGCIVGICEPEYYDVSLEPDNSWSESVYMESDSALIEIAYGASGVLDEDRFVEVQVFNHVQLPQYNDTLISISWHRDVDSLIQQIGAGTLTATDWQAENKDEFSKNVRERVLALIQASFYQYDIRVQPANNNQSSDVSLLFSDEVGSKFGEVVPADCDRSSAQAEVHLGYFVKSMVGSFQQWRPMSKADSPETRTEDIAYALADTAAHEITHALGLVTCNWMPTVDGTHNPARPHALSGNNSFRMAPGIRVPKYRRLGYRVPHPHRDGPRRLRSLNPLNAHFLDLVYGTP